MDADDLTPTIIVDGERRPMILCDGRSLYKFLKPIGTWGPDNRGTVYEALILPEKDPPVHVAVKVASAAIRDPPPHPPNLIQLANIEVETLTSLPRNCTSNILPIIKHYTDHPYQIQHFCIILPFDPKVSSLRSLILSHQNLSAGIPPRCIAIALICAITALGKIHSLRLYHQQITAGKMFYHHELRTIMLSCAASAYEPTGIDQSPVNNPIQVTPPTINRIPEFTSMSHDHEASTSWNPNPTAQDESLLPMNTMLEWARAPEVERDEDYWYNYVYTTEKSDIWLIGIAALELAYGKIQVSSREELLRIAKYVSSLHTLPNTWEELRTMSAETEGKSDEMEEEGWELEDFVPDFIKRWFNWSEQDHDLPAESNEDRRISKCLSKFLAKCLATNPRKRPSARRLLGHEFIMNNMGDMRHFYNSVVIGRSPHVDRFIRGVMRMQ